MGALLVSAKFVIGRIDLGTVVNPANSQHPFLLFSSELIIVCGRLLAFCRRP